MKARLAALAVLVVLGLAASLFFGKAKPLDPAFLADSARLLPVSSGDFRLQSTARNQFSELAGETVVEQTAVYGGGRNGRSVFVDLTLNKLGPHNAIACYLGRGERVRWQKMIDFPVDGKPASFAVAALTADGAAHIVASTNCWPDGCRETPAADWGLQFRGVFALPARAVSLVVESDAKGANDDNLALAGVAVETVRDFLAGFDMDRIQQAVAGKQVGFEGRKEKKRDAS